MRKFLAATLSGMAVLFGSACRDVTAPMNQQYVVPSFAKKVPAPVSTVAGNLTWAEFNFAGQSLAPTSPADHSAANAAVSTAVLSGTTSASSDTPVPIFDDPTNFFVGRFANTQTVALLNVPNGGSNYDLKFDFYAIGSWDGLGKQAQNGAFLPNLFQTGVICPAQPGVVIDIFTSTFSNQMTVQQNYPLPAGSTGGAKALTDSYASDNLFKGDPTVNVPVFRSVSDASYHMSYGGANPCGSGGFTIVFRTYAPGQQSAPDETWGIDNIVIKTDS